MEYIVSGLIGVIGLAILFFYLWINARRDAASQQEVGEAAQKAASASATTVTAAKAQAKEAVMATAQDKETNDWMRRPQDRSKG